MSYFPFFIDIKDKQSVIAGGGAVALRKIEKLLPFGCKITVISPEVCEEIKLLAKNDGVSVLLKKIEKEDIKNAFFVISATNDKKVNKEVSSWCKELNIPVNAVDDIDNCSFVFPALIKDETLTIGISTGGQNPEAAAALRQKIENTLPKNLGQTISDLGKIRKNLKETMPDQKDRMIEMKKLTDIYLQDCYNNQNK